jgi:uncharacterized protein involved in copper resistance
MTLMRAKPFNSKQNRRPSYRAGSSCKTKEPARLAPCSPGAPPLSAKAPQASKEPDRSQSSDIREHLLPHSRLELFAQDVPALGRGAGLSEVTAGLRVRYEIRRELAPYIDMSYSRLTGETAGIARDAGEEVEALAVRAGLRAWF